jgi:hypothetical protein
VLAAPLERTRRGAHHDCIGFPVLAAIGLPLKFAALPWASMRMALWRGLFVAGLLHRIAAFESFGYCACHLSKVAFPTVVRRRRGRMSSPRSIVAQPKDARDRVAMVSDFLRRRPRPQFDRWTCREKFDYLAAFWGVAMTGLTGLVPWFRGAFTKVLPGRALGAAHLANID